MSRPRRAVIIGGSRSGLFGARFLPRVGWQVDVFERCGVELVGRGAGITTHPELLDAVEKKRRRNRKPRHRGRDVSECRRARARSSHGCGPHGAAISSLTSCVMTSGRNFEAKPSTKSVL